MGTRSVFIAVPASIVNVLPSVHWQLPLFPPPSYSPPTQLCIEFSSCFLPPQPAGGQNHDSIVWSRFQRDYQQLSPCYSETSTSGRSPCRGVDKLRFNRFQAPSLIICKHSSHLLPPSQVKPGDKLRFRRLDDY